MHDWKIVALFYSALHRIDYRFARETGRASRNHFERNRLVEGDLPQVFEYYRDLYMMGMEARYRDGHRLGDNRRRSAVEAVDRIEDALPF